MDDENSFSPKLYVNPLFRYRDREAMVPPFPIQNFLDLGLVIFIAIFVLVYYFCYRRFIIRTWFSSSTLCTPCPTST
jgi:hypothetical protein